MRAKEPALARLIYAASESCADLLYVTGFFAPDPFLFVQNRGETILLVSDLEIDRARRQARADRIEAWSEWSDRLEADVRRRPGASEVIAAFLESEKILAADVPAGFPLGIARALEDAGVSLNPTGGPFWPQRALKRAEEVCAIEKALRITEAGLERAFEVLRATRVRGGKELVWRGGALTSEALRAEVDSAVLRAGGVPSGTIVAGGEQACDPHERGSGPLYAGQAIILDVFPRDARTGYYGDLTRTVVKGRAPETLRELWETVRRGQVVALDAMRPGVSGERIHVAVKNFFSGQGYPTEKREGRWVGFFHGTGHGLGLEIHEEPRFAAARFRAGQVFTVEPGLYIPGLGGVRIEDVVLVEPGGVRVLSDAPVFLEI